METFLWSGFGCLRADLSVAAGLRIESTGSVLSGVGRDEGSLEAESESTNGTTESKKTARDTVPEDVLSDFGGNVPR